MNTQRPSAYPPDRSCWPRAAGGGALDLRKEPSDANLVANQRIRVRNPNTGFTLIELIVTVVIIAVLASLALPLSEVTVQRSREHEFRRSLREIREAIDAYKLAVDDGRIPKNVGETGYPKTLEVLVQGVPDAKSPKPTKIYFLRRIPRDPFSNDPSKAPEATWGKRSYASGPDDPQAGDDIYDVYTLSSGKGLNGTPYREW